MSLVAAGDHAGRGVYIVGEVGRSDRRIKVGLTTVGGSRIVGVGKQCPGPLEVLWWWPANATSQLSKRERYLHHRWSALRIHGEWFSDEGELADFVRSPFTLSDKSCPTCGGALSPVWTRPGDTNICNSARSQRCQGRSLSGDKQCGATTALDELFSYDNNGTRWVRCRRCWQSFSESWPYENSVPVFVSQAIEAGEITSLPTTCGAA